MVAPLSVSSRSCVKKFEKILIVALCGVGDVILFVPHLRLLRQLYPQARIDMLLLPNGSQELIQTLQLCDNIFVFQDKRYLPIVESRLASWRNILAILSKVRRERYELALWPYAQTTSKKQILAWIIRANQTFLHAAQTPLRRWLPPSIVSVPFLPSEQVMERNTRLLTACGLPTENLSLTVNLPEEKKAWGKEFLSKLNSSGTLVFGYHAGGNILWTRDRQWPPERFAELADRLSRKFGSISVFFGIPSERPLLQKIVSLMTTEAHILDHLSLSQMAGVISHLRLLVGNESALVHLSGMQNTTTVSLVGPTNYPQTGPWGHDTHVIRLALSCSPCFETGFPIHCPHHLCLKGLTSEMVYERVVSILESKRDHSTLRPTLHHLSYREPDSTEWRNFLLERRKWLEQTHIN